VKGILDDVREENSMVRSIVRVLLCGALVFLGASLSAQDDDKPKDAEGCKDSPLITRFPGGIINSCENKEYEQADFPLGGDKTKHVEGDYHYWDIAT
jgi:hypothetical protein